MPYKDPEKQREQRHRWYEANREKVLEQTRARRADPAERERRRVYARQRYWADRERAAEWARAWRAANPERVRENMRRWREAGGVNPDRRRRNEAVEKLWREQDGRCYLCERPVPMEEAHLDHDHRCCPRLKFCTSCVRGVSCRGCNHAIGNAEDDPDRLELIAANLRAKLAEIDERLAARPAQLTLDEAN